MRLILALVLAVTPSAVFAGQRATFIAKDDPKALMVTLADNGDVRIEGTDEKEYGLRIGGVFYLVTRTETGATVARASDLSAAAKKAVPSEMRQLFGQLGKGVPKTNLKITPKGERTINGRTGKLYAISGLSGTKTADFVMSEDPALKPFGDNLTAYMAAVTAPAAILFGPMMDGILADMNTVFALGTPLDADGKFILTTVETVDTKPADFTLPAEPMSVDALAASFSQQGKSSVTAPPEDLEAMPMDDAADDTLDAAEDDMAIDPESEAAAMDAAADAMEAATDAAEIVDEPLEPQSL
ncbi:hypothetical protein [Sphingobium boeckii]|uniref:DUF4412 domain-containing protein n=1 Tax=Sphingobium boeckii TaxID=1082345 RepID=A0A7W9AEE9_9SPHN|nr:hypothetical protein [Sphingobium boeckii]MBB5684143.1 hypothetical protein [Sphingobium boeckii]